MGYKIVRMYYAANRKPRTIKRGLTLEEAQAHCRREDTHKRTGKPETWWFDGYDAE